MKFRLTGEEGKLDFKNKTAASFKRQFIKKRPPMVVVFFCGTSETAVPYTMVDLHCREWLPPLCKGRWLFALQKDGGIVHRPEKIKIVGVGDDARIERAEKSKKKENFIDGVSGNVVK